MLELTELAYAAGLVDGEGCIHAEKAHSIGNSYTVVVRVANTDVRMVNWLKETFGGFITNDSGRRNKGVRKTCYQWVVKSRKAKDFLVLIRPYLKIKSKQADIAVILQGLKGAYENPNNLGRTDEETAVEELLAAELANSKKGDA